MTTLISSGHRKCNAACYDAKHDKCNCICRGMNHGVGETSALVQTADVALRAEEIFGEGVVVRVQHYMKDVLKGV